MASAREPERRRAGGHALCGTLEAQATGGVAGQQVRAAQQAGRYLEANRLLDASGGDAPIGADAVRHIRETQSRVEEALELLKRADEGGGSDSGWSETSGPGYRVLYKYDGSTGEVEVVANITLDVEPLKLWTLLREFDLMPTWNASFQGVDLEASFASQCDFYHAQNKAIVRGVMNPTESYIERTYVDALAEHGKLIVVGQCPQQSASQHCGLDIPPVPRKVNRVVATSCDVVTPMNEKQVMITSHRKLKTPVSHLPQWVVRQAASILTNGNLTSFQKALESWDDSDFAERLRSGQRAEYYAQLRQQLLASTRG